MADHGIGTNPDRLPQFGQRHHHREEHRLHHVHPVQARSTGYATQDIGQRPVDEFGECFAACLDLPGEYRCGVEQFDTHALPLRALAGEDEHRLARGRRGAPNRRPTDDSSPATSSSPASNRSRSPPTTTARCSNAVRPANDHPTSAMSISSSARRCTANRAACALNADADFADNRPRHHRGRRASLPRLLSPQRTRQSHAHWCH